MKLKDPFKHDTGSFFQDQFDMLTISISGSLTQSNADQMQKYFLDQAQKKRSH